MKLRLDFGYGSSCPLIEKIWHWQDLSLLLLLVTEIQLRRFFAVYALSFIKTIQRVLGVEK